MKRDIKLYDKTIPELVQMMEELTSNPKNKNYIPSIFVYNKATQKKLDKIGEEIQYKIKQNKIRGGDNYESDKV